MENTRKFKLLQELWMDMRQGVQTLQKQPCIFDNVPFASWSFFLEHLIKNDT